MKALVTGFVAFIGAISTAAIAGTIVLTENGTQVATCTVSTSTIDASGNIQATVTNCTLANVPPPETVAGPDLVVNSPTGAALADGSGLYNFGTDIAGDGTPQLAKTFTMLNNGDAELTGVAVTIGGTHASDYTLSIAPPTTIAAGSSASFQIQFGASAAGTRSASLSIANNINSTKNPYTFSLLGTGEDAGVVPTGTDPGVGAGLWVPEDGLVVVDQSMGDDKTTYVPGCVNGRNWVTTDCDFSAFATDSYAGTNYNITANLGQTVSVRFEPTSTTGQAYYYPTRLYVKGQAGGNIYRNVVVSLSPTPGDFSMTGACKYESQGEAATIFIGPNHCAISPANDIYYLNIKPLESCTGLGCVFKVYNAAFVDIQ